MARRISASKVKSNRTYTVEQAADAIGVSEQTIRIWITQGLPVLSAKRPMLILGWALKDFITRKQQGQKRPLRLGEFFCFSCKEPRRAAIDMVEYHPRSPTHGRLRALCEVCECILNRNIRADQLPSWPAFYEVPDNSDEPD
ncbi:helix-turn-helix domain-containing protein [Amaricoccus tamworthensis]|uniref:helix-turn-helix domain-containing protein n=1 Tax=Amaricoccus tamworthensis TaxID=57002 RepID=UPI003C79E827